LAGDVVALRRERDVLASARVDAASSADLVLERDTAVAKATAAERQLAAARDGAAKFGAGLADAHAAALARATAAERDLEQARTLLAQAPSDRAVEVELEQLRAETEKFDRGLADALAVALVRATTAESDLAQARTTLPSDVDAQMAVQSELEQLRATAHERLVRAEAAEGEVTAAQAAVQRVSRKFAATTQDLQAATQAADAKQAVYAAGLADCDAKLRDLEATLATLRTQAAPTSITVQTELAARDRTIDVLQRDAGASQAAATMASAALEAANAEVAASRAAQRRDASELADAQRALQTPRSVLRSPLDDEVSTELTRERTIRFSIEAERDELLRTARNLCDAVTPQAYDGDADDLSLDDPPSLIEELESARKRAVDDDARNRDEVAALKASLAVVELDLRSEVEKREAVERALRRSAQKGPGSVDEVRRELQSVKEAARTAFGAVRALRTRSPIRSPEADPERAFYSREARRDARQAASVRLDVAERSLAPDAPVNRRASVSPPCWTGRRAARLDAVEPVLRPATSPDLTDLSDASSGRATRTRRSRRPSATCKKRRTRLCASSRRPKARWRRPTSRGTWSPGAGTGGH